MAEHIYNQEYLIKLQYADQQVATTRFFASEPQFGPPSLTRPHLHSFQKFMDLPTEVITEVLCNLTPFELLSLSHTCKPLREMITRRNAEYIWSIAENNSPSYPSYPWADISKPRFAGLLFMRFCSTCGIHTMNPLDPYLLVRLCSKCCPKELVGFPQPSQSTSLPLWELMPHTPLKCDPLLAVHPRYTLRKHYESISNAITLLSRSMAMVSYQRWTKETREEMKLRQKFGQHLYHYFERLESSYQKSLEGVRSQRTKEIKKRLRALGWTEDDFDFGLSQSKEWNSIANTPTLLTDQEWSEVHSKLEPLLFNNRNRVQQVRRGRSLAQQSALLGDFLQDLQSDLLWHPLLPFFRALGITHQPLVVTAFLDSYPFPAIELAKTWPFFLGIGNAELGESELKARFTADKERVKTYIAGWRTGIEVALANRLMEERGVNRTDRDTKTLPLHVQLLMRADSVFADGSSMCKPLYYPEFVPTKPQLVSGHTWPIISVDKFHRAPEPEQVARALLDALGLENASHLELATFGERFACSRCPLRLRKLMDWKGILNHYLDEQRLWKLAARTGPRFKIIPPISVECAHRIAPSKNLPLVELVALGSVKSWNSSISQLLYEEDKYFCFPCKNFGYAFLGSDVHVLRKHMRQVHACASPVAEDVHYGLIKEDKPFLETGAMWRTRWNEFNHTEGTCSEDESK